MLLEKFLELYDDFVATPFPTSAEGDTGAGGHEAAVAAYFVEKGFAPFPKQVELPLTGKQTKVRKAFVMNRSDHKPTEGLRFDVKEGYFTILQPYSSGRGSFNPAPDLYLIQIHDHKIVNWLGIECKSSVRQMWPTWNDNLPRPYRKGNIIYFLTGGDDSAGGAVGGAGAGPKTRNMIFTAEAFFGKTEDEIEAIPEMIVDIYKKGKTYIQDLATTAAPELAGRFVFGLRQKVEQSRPFSEEEIAGFTQLTKDFLQVHQAKIKADGDGTSVPSVVIAQVAKAGKELSSNSNSNGRTGVNRTPGTKLRRAGAAGTSATKKRNARLAAAAAAAIGGPGGPGGGSASKKATTKKKRPGNNNSNFNPSNNE